MDEQPPDKNDFQHKLGHVGSSVNLLVKIEKTEIVKLEIKMNYFH